MKRISVIIPVWNGEKYVAEAVSSVLGQEYLNKEVIVVNDGSTDATLEKLRGFGDQIVILSQSNQGLGASRNAGIRAATGEYYAFLDHDDRWLPGKLTAQMEAWRSSGDDPLVFSHVEQFICSTLSSEEKERVVPPQKILPGPIAGTLLMSKGRLEQIGPFLEHRQLLGEFIEWYLRALRQEIPTIMLQTVMLQRRIHQDNMGRRDLSRRGDYLRILKAHLDRKRQKELHAI
jgi:glycosyltransferase involved in cell wall biosynthesis